MLPTSLLLATALVIHPIAVTASSDDQPPPAAPRTAGSDLPILADDTGQFGLDADAAAVAKLYGISESEAVRQLQAERLVESYASSLGAAAEYVEIQRSDGFRIVVGAYDRTGIPASIGGFPLVVETPKASAQDLEDAAARLREELAPYAGRYDMNVDRRAARIEIRSATGDVGEATRSIGANLSRASSVEVAFAEEPVAVAAATLRGGDAITSCTAGFPVRDSVGDYLIMIAAHCPDSQSFGGNAMTIKDEAFSGSSDWQVNRIGNNSMRGRFRDGPASYRPNDGYFTSTSLVGATRCKFGQTTGADCGYITSVSYQPGYIPSANATFVVVHGATDMASPGDSGGPVYAGQVAYGIVSGVLNDVDLIYGQGTYAFAGGRLPVQASDLVSGETLVSGEDRNSFDRRFRLVMQTDGNLVLYKNGVATWATSYFSGFTFVRGSRAVMQTDGNLVVYSPSNVALWAASWNGLVASSGSEAIIQDDGNFVIYSASGVAKWATYTS